MRFVKLHRVAGCPAPYLPVEGGKSSRETSQSTFDLPDGDDDKEECIYSRQYFVGTSEYDSLLERGTAYLDKQLDECLYYQSCDGQLCYLSGINMACLLEEFSLHRNEHNESHSRSALPLPDVVEGVVIQREEAFCIAPPIRWETEITSVEIDWYSGGQDGHKPMLTKATLNKFKSEIQRRKTDRQHASKGEDKADKAAEMKLEKRDRRRRIETFGSAYPEGASDKQLIQTTSSSKCLLLLWMRPWMRVCNMLSELRLSDSMRCAQREVSGQNSLWLLRHMQICIRHHP